MINKGAYEFQNRTEITQKAYLQLIFYVLVTLSCQKLYEYDNSV